MISTRSMKSSGMLLRLTRLAWALFDTARLPSIRTSVRLSPSDRRSIVASPSLWALPPSLVAELDNDTNGRSEEHTSELQSLMRISYAVFCLKKKKTPKLNHQTHNTI